MSVFASQALRFHMQRIRHDDDSTCLRIEVRSEHQQIQTVTSSGEDSEDETNHRQNDTDKMAEILWGLMLVCLRDVEGLIGKFAGE